MWIGLDDTDVQGSPGTNQLARQIARSFHRFGCHADLVLRHQLLVDPRVPCTTQNGSASILVSGWPQSQSTEDLWDWLVQEIKDFAPPGSDPALALTTQAPSPKLTDFGLSCKRRLVDPQEAVDLAASEGIRLMRIAGRNHGLIGALAAIGLAGGGNDGRVIHREGWPWPDHFAGRKSLSAVLDRGIDRVECIASKALISEGEIRIRKRLRPAWRGYKVVLFVEPDPLNDCYLALKCP